MEKLLKALKHITQLFQANYREKKLNFRQKMKSRPLQIKSTDIEISNVEKKIKNISHYQKDKINQIQLYG